MRKPMPNRQKSMKLRWKCRSISASDCRNLSTRSVSQGNCNFAGIPLGLVINFGDSRLGHSGIARVILKGANTPDA